MDCIDFCKAVKNFPILDGFAEADALSQSNCWILMILANPEKYSGWNLQTQPLS